MTERRAKRLGGPTAAIVEAPSVERQSYEVLQRSLRELGFEDGAPWDLMTARERAIWTARCRATMFLIAHAIHQRERQHAEARAHLEEG